MRFDAPECLPTATWVLSPRDCRRRRSLRPMGLMGRPFAPPHDGDDRFGMRSRKRRKSSATDRSVMATSNYPGDREPRAAAWKFSTAVGCARQRIVQASAQRAGCGCPYSRSIDINNVPEQRARAQGQE